MRDRRRFIRLLPFAGAAVITAACSKKAADVPAPAAPAPATPAPTPPTAAPTEATAPAPAPAVSPAPAPTPAPAPAPAAPTATTSGAMVDPNEPTALALGYVPQASKVDRAKYPGHVEGQACANCALFGGTPGASSGPCPLFAGRQVLATGWCGSYTKKAG